MFDYVYRLALKLLYSSFLLQVGLVVGFCNLCFHYTLLSVS